MKEKKKIKINQNNSLLWKAQLVWHLIPRAQFPSLTLRRLRTGQTLPSVFTFHYRWKHSGIDVTRFHCYAIIKMKGCCEGVITEQKARTKSFPQEEVAKEKADGQSLPAPLLPAEVAAGDTLLPAPWLSGPSWRARPPPVRSHPPPVSWSARQVSLCQETMWPFGLRWKTAPLWSPSFLRPWWEEAGAHPARLQAGEQRGCCRASTARPAPAEHLLQTGRVSPRHCRPIGHRRSTGLHHRSLEQRLSLNVVPRAAFSLLNRQWRWSQNGSCETWRMPSLPRNLRAGPGQAGPGRPQRI